MRMADFSVVWNSGNLNNVNVCLVNANNAVFANDFAIDDAIFKAN